MILRRCQGSTNRTPIPLLKIEQVPVRPCPRKIRKKANRLIKEPCQNSSISRDQSQTLIRGQEGRDSSSEVWVMEECIITALVRTPTLGSPLVLKICLHTSQCHARPLREPDAGAESGYVIGSVT